MGPLLVNSTRAVAKAEVIKPATGEYRVVLQGILDQEESRLEDH